jgi:hypothetical protein
MIHEFGWKEDDLEKIGWGIAVSHLLECAGQVTGGYFADPGYKDVEDLANLGFPIAEVSDNKEGVITKLPDTGGEVSTRILKEQLLYEVHDPTSYKTADGFSDFSKVKFEQIDKNIVKVSGGWGTKQPEIMKVVIGFKNGFFAEAQIGYGGEGSHLRAKLATKILIERIKNLNLEFEGLRFDFTGSSALWPHIISSPCEPKEVILRVVGRSKSKRDAHKLCNEVEALYTNGPARMTKIKLREIAHARSGDKGDYLNIVLIPYEEKNYGLLKEKVTIEKIKEHFSSLVKGDVTRYEIDNLKLLNFVFQHALDGGVTQSLRLDKHGKTLSFKLLDMEIEGEIG